MANAKRWTIATLAASRGLARTFHIWERLGFHVTQNHFYGPVPDTRKLGDDIWERESALVGIEIDEGEQLRRLDDFENRFKAEYTSLPTHRTESDHEFYLQNKTFLSVDAEMLYCFVRSARPRRIIEVGSGQSTYLAAQAARRNEEDGAPACELVVIDPYPLDPIRRGFPGLSRLIAEPVEKVDLAVFDALDANDILFIDTSHVLRIGGDVQYEFLEVMPRLKPGVIVHLHDIFLPAEYPRDWIMRDRLFFTEQYLLQAFLAFNHEF